MDWSRIKARTIGLAAAIIFVSVLRYINSLPADAHGLRTVLLLAFLFAAFAIVGFALYRWTRKMQRILGAAEQKPPTGSDR